MLLLLAWLLLSLGHHRHAGWELIDARNAVMMLHVRHPQLVLLLLVPASRHSISSQARFTSFGLSAAMSSVQPCICSICTGDDAVKWRYQSLGSRKHELRLADTGCVRRPPTSAGGFPAHPSLDTGGGMNAEPASGGHCGGKPCTPPNMALGSKPPGPPTMAPLTPGICMPGGRAKPGSGGPAC